MLQNITETDAKSCFKWELLKRRFLDHEHKKSWSQWHGNQVDEYLANFYYIYICYVGYTMKAVRCRKCKLTFTMGYMRLSWPICFNPDVILVLKHVKVVHQWSLMLWAPKIPFWYRIDTPLKTKSWLHVTSCKCVLRVICIPNEVLETFFWWIPPCKLNGFVLSMWGGFPSQTVTKWRFDAELDTVAACL